MLKKLGMLSLCLGLCFSTQTSFAGDDGDKDFSQYRSAPLFSSETALALENDCQQVYRPTWVPMQDCQQVHCSTGKLFLWGASLVLGTAALTLLLTKIGCECGVALGSEETNFSQTEPLRYMLDSQTETLRLMAGNFSGNISFISEEIDLEGKCLSVMYNTLRDEIPFLHALSIVLERNLTQYFSHVATQLTNLYEGCETYRLLERVSPQQVAQFADSCRDFLEHHIHKIFNNASLITEND